MPEPEKHQINRRTVIKQFFILAGGLVIASSCHSNGPGNPSIRLDNIQLTEGDEDFLAELTEMLIPKTEDSLGANDLNLHLFVMKMIDTCNTPREQQEFIIGLRSLKARFRLSKKEQIFVPENIRSKEATFFQLLRNRTLQGFLNSQYIMTQKLVYELVPSSPYDGFVKDGGANG